MSDFYNYNEPEENKLYAAQFDSDPQPINYALPVIPPDFKLSDSPLKITVTKQEPDIPEASGSNAKSLKLMPVEHDPFVETVDTKKQKENLIASSNSTGLKPLDKLLGLGGETRYQLWPERMVRSGLTLAGDVASGAVPDMTGLRREDFTDLPPPSQPATAVGRFMNLPPVPAQPGDVMMERALDMTGLAGTGGLAGGVGEGAEAALGSTPFLRPALKYQGKIYKAPVGGQHLDALPPELVDTFNKMAMSGEDISHFDFGFMNHKGQFLNRDRALDYAIKEGLIDPSAGQYGTLTSTLMSDSSKPGVAIEAMKNASPFYSNLENVASAIPTNKMPGSQWLATLKNKPGVKPEEMEWTGLNKFLTEKGNEPVTKQEMQDFLNENKVQLNEIWKGDLKFNTDSKYALPEVIKAAKEAGDTPGNLQLTLANDGNAYRALTKKFPELSENENWSEIVANDVFGGDTMPKGTTKYSQYVLPSGDNYREMLLTLPDKNQRMINGKLSNYNNEGNLIGFHSSHWDEPNVLAHVRMNDRTMNEPGYSVQNIKSGNKSQVFASKQEAEDYQSKLPSSVQTKITEDVMPKKSLHLEELQSDWHQKGRKEGYKDKNITNQTVIDAEKQANIAWQNATNLYAKEAGIDLSRAKDNLATVASIPGTRAFKALPLNVQEALKNWNDKWSAYQLASKNLDEQGSKVPDAPFKTTKAWTSLLLKRMLREAAEKGYDRLSWTPGEEQALRYPNELRQVANHIEWHNKYMGKVDPVGNKRILIDTKKGGEIELTIDKDGVVIEGLPDAKGKNLSEIIGKDMAHDIMNKDEGHIAGKDFIIGGEDMKEYYNKILPNTLKDIAKEHGLKVEQGNLHNIKYVAKDDEGNTVADFNNQIEGKRWINQMGNKYKLQKNVKNYPVSYIDLPQSLKNQALRKGFPLFSGPTFVPVDHDPFEEKQQ